VTTRALHRGRVPKAERARFLRELGAAKLNAKKERRAQRERELAEKIRATWSMEGATFEGLPIVSGRPR
jgi:hypothetical protein